MSKEADIRTLAHELVDRMSVERIRALLELLDDEYFSPEEAAEIRELRASDEWHDWRKVRNDV